MKSSAVSYFQRLGVKALGVEWGCEVWGAWRVVTNQRCSASAASEKARGGWSFSPNQSELIPRRGRSSSPHFKEVFLMKSCMDGVGSY